jgi:hypothetical protein
MTTLEWFPGLIRCYSQGVCLSIMCCHHKQLMPKEARRRLRHDYADKGQIQKRLRQLKSQELRF